MSVHRGIKNSATSLNGISGGRRQVRRGIEVARLNPPFAVVVIPCVQIPGPGINFQCAVSGPGSQAGHSGGNGNDPGHGALDAVHREDGRVV